MKNQPMKGEVMTNSNSSYVSVSSNPSEVIMIQGLVSHRFSSFSTS